MLVDRNVHISDISVSFNNVLINVELTVTKINKCCQNIVHCYFMLTNETVLPNNHSDAIYRPVS